MIPTLKEMCNITVLKFGLGPRTTLAQKLPLEMIKLEAEMIKLETLMKRHMSGRLYSDYHVSYRDECELDITWCYGMWTIIMRHNGILHMAKIGAGVTTRLVRRWKKVFLFANSEPYPGLYDIAVHDFEIKLEERSVVFFGSYFNENSGTLAQFQTKFTFSATSHLLKVQTGAMINGMLAVVGLRFLRQPDTNNYDLYR